MSGITYANIRQTPKQATSCAVIIVKEKNDVPKRQVVTCGMSSMMSVGVRQGLVRCNASNRQSCVTGLYLKPGCGDQVVVGQ
ncbi:hypothetical protein IQ06DRAFT_22384 [Phaeosphaeriaceae sp. SRC1lsM3a]|nr:hypothetical protein IQ06DRAFT_22384 [Stagonospora sp. SRC1lsM3a]